MDIACPNCAATYRVPDALIDGANALRCVACGHTWVPDPPRPAPAPAEAAAPPPVVEPPPPPPPPPPPSAPPPPASPPDPAPLPAAAPPAAAAPASPAPPPPLPETTVTLTPTRAAPPHLAPRRLPEGGRRRADRSRQALSAAWALSIALVIIFVLGLALYHAEISEVWPPFARLAG